MAARRLKVDNTTVSRRIAELERALGSKLFDRSSEGFVLTEQGHHLFVVAERVEEQLSKVSEELGQGPGAQGGRVRVVAMEGISAFFLAERFAPLVEEEPALIVELATERHLVNLSKREADIFVSFEAPSGPRLIAKKAGSFRLALYGSQSYIDKHGVPASTADLSSHLYIDYIEDLVAIPSVHWLLDVIDPLSVVFRSSSMHVQQNAIASGMGIGLLPLFSAKSNPKLVPILANEVKVFRDVYITVHADIESMSRVKRVRKYLSRVIESETSYLNEF